MQRHTSSAKERFFSKKGLLLAVIDATIFLCGFLLSWALNFIDRSTALSFSLPYFALLALALLLSRQTFRIYHNLWRFPSTRVYLELIFADFSAGLCAWVCNLFFSPAVSLPYATLTSTVILIITLTSRFLYRLLLSRSEQGKQKGRIPVAIVGAGHTGALLVNELLYHKKSSYVPYCFIDTDPQKTGALLNGVKIYGESKETIAFLKNSPVQEIFITVSEKDGNTLSKLYDFYAPTGLKIKLYDFPVHEYGATQGNAPAPGAKRQIRDFKIEDLLFRETQKMEQAEISAFLANKTILVTGGGGSIGSELCRQIAKCAPKALIVLDIYENNAYDIEQELSFHYPHLALSIEIASVRDLPRMECIFSHYRPDVVFHAAAHKHVPLMERAPSEAIKNNVFGTYHTANLAEKYGVQKFILISTDKAVNPTNVMGASKRLCEMVIQCRTDSKTSFACVRFGNVLGSNGSVIPLFRRQIEAGGPLTLTDRRIIRYFMTIPEAAQLVLSAGALATNGELFVLNMGKPVRILELAENMIRLSGLEPYVDIEIKEIGLRPGEKLYEELLMQSETLSATKNEMIFVEKDTPLTRAQMEEKLSLLKGAIEACEDDLSPHIIRNALMQTVPTYKTPQEVNALVEDPILSTPPRIF